MSRTFKSSIAVGVAIIPTQSGKCDRCGLIDEHIVITPFEGYPSGTKYSLKCNRCGNTFLSDGGIAISSNTNK